MKRRLTAGFATVLLVIFGALVSSAQAQVKTEPGVARISLIHGDVSTQRGDSGEWAAVALNAPIVAGDRISTGDRSRTEVQLDYANILRLDEHAQATVAGLTRTQIQVQIGRGLANYSVFKDSEADAEIDTPNVSIRPDHRDGSYRILVSSDSETEVLVRKGDAEISTPQGSTRLEKGQLITVQGTGNDTQYKIAEAPSKDDWDRWNNDRDNTIRNAQAWSHTDRYYVGSEDLDAYGSWTTVPDYGPVWVPVVEVGWAPYRVGRWVWEPYWGWTWVSYEPWGWAPYHYGRWFLYGGRWAWWPGPVYGGFYRPVWAPAYVSFFGFGGGVGFGFSFGGGWGSIGWLPIGPCDRFYPWWGGYRGRFNVVNITNIYNYNHGGIPPLRSGRLYSNLRLAITDERVRQGISTVGAGDFGRGHIVPRQVTPEQFRGGRFVAGNLPVVPSRESLRVGERAAAPSTIVRTQPQRFFTGNRPVATPQPFQHEQAQIQSAIQRDGHFQPIVSGGRPSISIGTSNPALRVQTGDSHGVTKQAGPPVSSGSNTGWSRFARPEQTPVRGSVGAGPNSGKQVVNGTLPGNRQVTNQEGNSQWRRFEHSSGPATGTAAPTQGPVRVDRNQREESAPVQNRGNEWQKFPPPTSRPAIPESIQRNDSWQRFPSSGSAPEVQRNQGTWREPTVRQPAREYSRPPLEMRQPIVIPRSSGPSSSGGNHGGYHGSGGGGGGRPAPSHGGGGGGGGQPHSSGSGGGPHRGR